MVFKICLQLRYIVHLNIVNFKSCINLFIRTNKRVYLLFIDVHFFKSEC